MPSATSVHEDADQWVVSADRRATAMSGAALIFSSHPSVVAMITTGLTVVITSSIRPLLKWIEFRAYLSLLRALAPRNDDSRPEYISDAMTAFRSRGKAGKGTCQNDFVESNSSVRVNNSGIDMGYDQPTLGRLSWRVARNIDGGNCVQVALKGDMVVIGKEKNPNGLYLTYTWAEWKAFVESIKQGGFEDLK